MLQHSSGALFASSHNIESRDPLTDRRPSSLRLHLPDRLSLTPISFIFYFL